MRLAEQKRPTCLWILIKGTTWEKVASPDVPQELGPCRLLQVSAGLNSVWALTKDGQVHTWKRFLRHAKKSLQFSHVYLRYWPSVGSRCSVKRLNFRASRIGPSACSGSQSEHRFGFVLRAGVVNHIIGTLLSINDGGSENVRLSKAVYASFWNFSRLFQLVQSLKWGNTLEPKREPEG